MWRCLGVVSSGVTLTTFIVSRWASNGSSNVVPPLLVAFGIVVLSVVISKLLYNFAAGHKWSDECSTVAKPYTSIFWMQVLLRAEMVVLACYVLLKYSDGSSELPSSEKTFAGCAVATAVALASLAVGSEIQKCSSCNGHRVTFHGLTLG